MSLWRTDSFDSGRKHLKRRPATGRFFGLCAYIDLSFVQSKQAEMTCSSIRTNMGRHFTRRWPQWRSLIITLLSIVTARSIGLVKAFTVPVGSQTTGRRNSELYATSMDEATSKKKVIVIGAGWGGLSAAHALSKDENIEVTIVEASPRVGGLVRDGFTTMTGSRPAEAGQHGFWDNYNNIYKLLADLNLDTHKILTDYAPQGQYSPKGLEAIWPIYRDQPINLPTGLAQAAYTKFCNLSVADRLSAVPLVLAFSEFDDSAEAWKKYDNFSFRDLCIRLGVSKTCYEQAFEPMILTGLFAPGAECSAAAALGMAYFFVLKSQNSFDVQWCRGNIGNVIFDPWVEVMKEAGVKFETSTRVVGFEVESTDSIDCISRVNCKTSKGTNISLEADKVVFGVGGEALKAFVRYSPELARYDEFRRFANLRGTSVLATRVFLDRSIHVPYSANACWGFDTGVGMTMFDINTIHGPNCATVADAPGSVLEVDYYHASPLLVMDDDTIVTKVKKDLDTILGSQCKSATVVDAAIVRLPNAVNWYSPGSYANMPDVKSEAIDNAFFVGDIVRTRHGSWSQEKAFVTGIEAANEITGRPLDTGILQLSADETHVALGRNVVSFAKKILGAGNVARGPSLVDFLWR